MNFTHTGTDRNGKGGGVTHWYLSTAATHLVPEHLRTFGVNSSNGVATFVDCDGTPLEYPEETLTQADRKALLADAMALS